MGDDLNAMLNELETSLDGQDFGGGYDPYGGGGYGAPAPARGPPGGGGGSVWREATDGKGRVYYYNKQTKETSWKKPPDFDGPSAEPNRAMSPGRGPPQGGMGMGGGAPRGPPQGQSMRGPPGGMGGPPGGMGMGGPGPQGGMGGPPQRGPPGGGMGGPQGGMGGPPGGMGGPPHRLPPGGGMGGPGPQGGMGGPPPRGPPGGGMGGPPGGMGMGGPPPRGPPGGGMGGPPPGGMGMGGPPPRGPPGGGMGMGGPPPGSMGMGGGPPPRGPPGGGMGMGGPPPRGPAGGMGGRKTDGTDQRYFYANADRNQAEAILQRYGAKTGNHGFLMRPSRNENNFAISMLDWNKREVHHTLIKKLDNGQYCFEEQMELGEFGDVPTMISRVKLLQQFKPLDNMADQ